MQGPGVKTFSGGVTLIDQCVRMIVPNFEKKRCILKVCVGTQMYAIFSKRALFDDDILAIYKKGYVFVIRKKVNSCKSYHSSLYLL